MLNENEFIALSSQIVDQCFPEERKFWSANKREVTKRIYRAESLQAAAPEDAGDFKFLGEIQAGLAIAGQAAALISAMMTIYVTLKQLKNDTALEQIQKALQDAGVATEKAAKIGELVKAWPVQKA